MTKKIVLVASILVVSVLVAGAILLTGSSSAEAALDDGGTVNSCQRECFTGTKCRVIGGEQFCFPATECFVTCNSDF